VSPTTGHTTTYTAPTLVPTPNPVRVTVQTGLSGRSGTLTARIRVATEVWEGNAAYLYDSGEKIEAVVTWAQTGAFGTLRFFEASGSVRYTMAPSDCNQLSLLPNTGIISGVDGFLQIDYGTDPPTFLGVGNTVWNATHCFQCLSDPSDCEPINIGGSWFFEEGRAIDAGTGRMEGILPEEMEAFALAMS
jgi:hypothetical protein